MKINQEQFYSALDSAISAYTCYFTINGKYYTAEKAELIRAEIQLLKHIRKEMLPWTCEEIIIDEMPF